MAIWHEIKENAFIIYIDEHELTEDIIDRMRQVLTVAFLNSQYNIILDMSACKMIDSYFIGLLISTYREVKELGGQLYCVGLNGQVKNAFEIIRLDRIISTYDQLETAMKDINPPSENPS